MKNNKKRSASFYVWAVIYSLLGLLLTFLIVWNIALALHAEWAIELRSLFNTDVRNTQYFASTTLLLQTLTIIVALILVACLIVNDNHDKVIVKMKRKLLKNQAIQEVVETEETIETEE